MKELATGGTGRALVFFSNRNRLLEQRTTARYQLILPVLFDWQDPEGTFHREGGFTRNVSTRGLYVDCSTLCPPAGALLRIEVLLPVHWRRAPQGAKLVAGVKVLRVQEVQGKTAFAAMGNLDHIGSFEKEDAFGIESLLERKSN
jgi:hypothetical protein